MPDFARSSRPVLGLAVAAACLALAAPALAQQAQRPGEMMGMRYLTWAGKPATPAADGLRRPDVQTAYRAAPTGIGPGRPSRYGAPSANAGLTPASAWTSPAPRPLAQPAAMAAAQPQPQPMPMPMPTPPAPVMAAAAPTPGYTPVPYPPVPETRMAEAALPADAPTASAPEYMPPSAMPGRRMRSADPYFSAPPQARAAMSPDATSPVNPNPYDPMAPRPDALIFQMNQAAAAEGQPQPQQQAAASEQPQAQPQYQPAPTPGGPARQGARLYSLHRAAGMQPDPLVLPESVYLDGSSVDLAEPPPVPIQTRTANGRAQILAQSQEPSLP